MALDDGHKTVAVMYADLRRSGIGTGSYVGRELAGKSVLRRTVERLGRAGQLGGIVVFCPAGQAGQVGGLVKGTWAEVVGLREGVVLSRAVKRRKWALASWRGGLGEATHFDEQTFTAEMVAVLRERGVHTVLNVPSEAVLVDSALVDGLLAHHRENGDLMRFTFAHVPPGLVGCAYRVDLLGELVETGLGVGVLLAYNPDRPHADYINEPCTYRLPQALSRVDFRYVADTQRSWAVLEKVLAAGNGQAEGWGAQEVVAAVEKQKQGTDTLPYELEVEINTERSVRIAGYPHGRSGQRGPMSVEQFRKIVEDCRGYDDVCLTVGGYGEPLAHGDLPEMVAAAKAAGIYGINVETDGRRLTGELAAALAEGPADVISVYLDADSEEGYRQAKGEEGFAQVAANVGAFAERSWARGGPLVAPHLVKTRETMAEMEAFYDRWLRQCGAAVITGYNDFAGQIADRAVMNMAPPKRTACGRLGRCLTILADGQAVFCQQDFAGKFAIGSVLARSVGEIWRGQELENLREAHRQEKYGDGYLCGTCKEWHR